MKNETLFSSVKMVVINMLELSTPETNINSIIFNAMMTNKLLSFFQQALSNMSFDIGSITRSDDDQKSSASKKKTK